MGNGIGGRIDISAVVNLHREGTGAQATLISAWRAVENARAHGLRVTLTLVLDSSDDETTGFATDWAGRFGARTLPIEVGDLGDARNTAAAHSEAEWIAFLDGDDLWSENWLTAAHSLACGLPTEIPHALHPQINVIFGDHHSLLHHIDSTDPQFRWSRFVLQNMWTALCFTRTELLDDLPYPRNDLAAGFGFEDWSWNMAVLDSGGRHTVVADTCHFIRRSDTPSLLAQSQHALRSPYLSVPPRDRQVDDWPVGRPAPDSHTHRLERVELTDVLAGQIRLAAAAEPSVLATLPPSQGGKLLLQNFNTHNTAPQLALEELWSLRGPELTIGNICERSTKLRDLDPADRRRVTAEFFRLEAVRGRPIGRSVELDEARQQFPQLSVFERDAKLP